MPHPLNPQSLNRFSYTLNNPVKYTDPTGHAEVCDDPSCGANPPSNPSNNGEVPTTPTAPPANPPVNAPTNPNPEQGDDCKRHCDDADRADGSPSSPTRSPKAEFRGKCLGYCTGDGEEEKRGGPIGNGTGEAGNGTAGGGCAGVSGWWLYGCSDYNPWRVRWEKGINEARVNSQGLSQVQINQRVGNAFRDEVANYYRGQGFNVETEQTILTKWGPRRLDVVIKNGSGDTLLAVETKVGGASYGPIQRIKDDIITQELGFQVQPYWNWYNSPPPIVP